MNKVLKHWFKHDFYAGADDKIMKLNTKLPGIGYGIYWQIVELLYRTDGQIDYDLEFLGMVTHCDQETIKSVVEDFSLFEFDDEVITSNRVSRGLKEITEKSDKARQSALKRHNKRGGEEPPF